MKSSPLVISGKFKFAFMLAVLVLLITGSFLSIDWMNTLTGSSSFYPAYAKPAVSVLCALIAFFAWRGLNRRDYWLVAVSFICIVIVDITMSIYVYSPNKALGNAVFFIGAGLSIVAHILLLIRHAKGFKFLGAQRSGLSKIGFPLAFFLPVIALFIVLIPYLNAVGQFWPSLIYAIILTASLWVAWEAFRNHLFPRTNAWLLALGVTCWFVCELVGVVHNIEIGYLSTLAMNLTWHFYMPAILLLAFSAYDFGEKAG